MNIRTINPSNKFLCKNFSYRNKGFALITTIIVMSLLAVIALGMMSISSLEVRSSSHNRDRAVAMANARMALLIAISELQESTGADTRITASADVLSGSSLKADGHVRQLTGAWRSWESLNHNPSNGRPIAPDYAIKNRKYEAGIPSSGRFIRWLVSGDEKNLQDPASPPILVKTSETIPLLAAGSLNPQGDRSLSEYEDREVHVIPTEIKDSHHPGTYAWWIQGENSKARLKPKDVASQEIDIVRQMLLSPGPSGEGVGVADTAKSDRAITHQTLEFIKNSTVADAPSPREFFHDISVHSKGLLTNVSNGGWKRDLSLFSENFANVTEGFSSFTLSPGNVWNAGKSNTTSTQSPLIYPWVSDWVSNAVFTDTVSWNALVDYSTQYRRLTSVGNKVARLPTEYSKTKQNWVEIVNRLPVVARIHHVISLTAVQNAKSPSKYQPAIILTPVITLWNPYDKAIDCSNVSQNITINLQDASCPVVLKLKVGTKTLNLDLAKIVSNKNNNASNISAVIPLKSPEVWLPGEVRSYSPEGNTIAKKDRGNDLLFEAGYRPDSGLEYRIIEFSEQDAAVQMSIESATVNATFSGPNVAGTGMYFTVTHFSDRDKGGRSINNMSNLIDAEDVPKALGTSVPLTFDSSVSLSSLSNSPQPFLSSIIGLRYARDTNPFRENIVTNGIHNMNPTIGYAVSGVADSDATVVKGRFDHYPYEIQLFPINSLGDPGTPSGIDGELEGYLGSGFGSIDGLSNLILLELPTSPLLSLGDLQHFNVNSSNSRGPYTLNALGNSTTSPFIKSDEIRINSDSYDTIGYDHSLTMNHLFQDDWFVSGVAPETGPWSPNASRSLAKVYEEHLSGEEALLTHFYKPVETITGSAAEAEATKFLSDKDAWLKIASELEVEGMFNINSTSELAWEMLLKRNFSDGKAGFMQLDNSVPGNANATTSIESSAGTPFPRTSLISDETAGAPGYSMLSQPMRFSDIQIKALAREIVVEIKKRGPFLSMSEFYNRQLSNDKELAKSGAVESALQRLSETNGAENPYTELQSSFSEKASVNDFTGAALSYPFPEAAEGNPAYGFPGWTRQADVLRPISGVLSARDDTFTIRSYGAATDSSGNVVAEAWCEAVVQRTTRFVSGDDKHTLPTEEDQPMGRRYEIKLFRWLNPDEV